MPATLEAPTITAPTPSPSVSEQIDKAYEKAVTDNSPEKKEPVAAAPVASPKPTETAPQDKPQETAPASETSEEEPLGLTAEQLAEVQKDPKLAKTYKSLQAAFTRKTQEMSEQRKKFEQYQPLIEKFQASPQDTVRELAKHYGISLAEAKEVQAQATTDNVVESLKKHLGPELEFLADKFAPAIKEIVAAQAKEVVAPLQAQQQEFLDQNIAKQTEAEMATFEAKFPDWKKHEPAMTAIMAKFQPGKDSNIKTPEYLEMVYHLATRGQSEAAATRKVVDAINTAAKSAESSAPAVPAQAVTKAPPPFVNMNDAIDQAFADAQRGIRYERA